MTCEHVLALIDVGPFADVPKPRRDAARAHAVACPTCGPALAAATGITNGLRGLASPVPPAHLKTAVMARIASVDLSDHGHDRAREDTRAGARPLRQDWSGLAPLAGLLVGLVVVVAVYGGTGNLIRIRNIGWGPVLPDTLSGATALVGALGIFVVGLLVPIKWRRT